MPNYCQCFLEVSSNEYPTPDWEPFLSSIRSEDGKWPLSFDRVIPYPAEWRKMDDDAEAARKEFHEGRTKVWPQNQDGYNQGGYEWSINNWGTKWDAIEPKETNGGKPWLLFEFRTAWSPPTPVIAKLAGLWPALNFTLEYFERGMEYGGCIEWRDGKIYKQSEFKYYGHFGG